jgi:hypothetical protein
MKKSRQSSLTRKATQALEAAVAKVIEDHRRRGMPLAVWRDGKAVLIPAEEAGSRVGHRSPAKPDRVGRKAKSKRSP